MNKQIRKKNIKNPDSKEPGFIYKSPNAFKKEEDYKIILSSNYLFSSVCLATLVILSGWHSEYPVFLKIGKCFVLLMMCF